MSALRLAIISGRFSCHRQFLGIHQCPLIDGSSQVFNLDTFIHIVGHVLIVVCVEDLSDWWHLLYATSLIVPVFMRFQLL